MDQRFIDAEGNMIVRLRDRSGNVISPIVSFNSVLNKEGQTIIEKVQEMIDEIPSGGGTSVSGYTKEETDEKLTLKANAESVYTKSEIINMFDTQDVYSKEEINNKLDTKANIGDSYVKAVTYTKEETLGLVEERQTGSISGNADTKLPEFFTRDILLVKFKKSGIVYSIPCVTSFGATSLAKAATYYYSIGVEGVKYDIEVTAAAGSAVKAVVYVNGEVSNALPFWGWNLIQFYSSTTYDLNDEVVHND